MDQVRLLTGKKLLISKSAKYLFADELFFN